MNFKKLLLSNRPIIWDGATGTNLESRPGLSLNEELNLKYPEAILNLHRSFLEAGADVIETNTFSANRIILEELGLEHDLEKINSEAVRLAQKAIKEHKSKSPKFISGSIGPTNKLPTLGHISFDNLAECYIEQIGILVRNGIDIIQIETCQDILQTKAAVFAAKTVLKNFKKNIPIIVTITVEQKGTTLLGTEVGAALAAIIPYGIDAFGLNCATGPKEMEENLHFLKNNSPLPIALLPNAGLPEVKDGKTIYPLSPFEFAEWIEYYVKKLNVKIVGGCCGTTPEHIKAVAEKIKRKKIKLKHRAPKEEYISSLYSPISIDQEPKPLIIGERMNINGSKEFREYILSEKFDSAAEMSKRQAQSGAHILDLSVAYAGRDEIKDMDEMSKRLSKISPLPLMIDSTNPSAIEAALSHFPGRSIINSINLEDSGKKAEKIFRSVSKYGAGLVALTIDEDGMALTNKKKIEVARRLIKFCIEKNIWPDGHGILFIDPLTFTLADPKAASFGSGIETLKALKKIKRIKPPRKFSGKIQVRTVLGVSNISYGFKPEARKVLNSIFLNEAVKNGLDAAIVHAGQISPLHKIDPKALKLALSLIYNKSKNALTDFVSYFEKTDTVSIHKNIRAISPEEDLKNKILDGNKNGLEENLSKIILKRSPQSIINEILLPAMQEVGKLFGSGKLPLPFVLQSAETMRTATDFLAPSLKGKESEKRGGIVIATVRGDVHDIGKNLVDIILSNNGFSVFNIGVKQRIETVVESALKTKSDAIGLSGLLVQSCFIMKEDLAELEHRKIKIPVICGGAALTRKFVETELQNVYSAPVYYAKDAFDGLNIMNEIIKTKGTR